MTPLFKASLITTFYLHTYRLDVGMAFGPATAAILGQLNYSGDIFTVHTSPGWVMFVLWTIYFMGTFIYFDDPDQAKARKVMTDEKKNTIQYYNNEKSPLMPINTERKQDEQDVETIGKKRLPPLWKNIPVMSTLWNYFVLKLVLECLLSSSSMLTSLLFHWNMTKSGCLLAILGLLMFPANLFVAKMSLQYEEREMIKSTLSLILLGLCGVLMFGNEDYTTMQYVFFSVSIFVGTNAMEGPNMSLLSKTIPQEWARGTFNSGLLATEAGTFGRVIGDVLVSLVCFLINDNEEANVLNGIFIPNLLLILFTLVLNIAFFTELEPKDDDEEDDTASETSFTSLKTN